MENERYRGYTIQELELIAPYDPEAEAELALRRGQPETPEPEPEAVPAAPPVKLSAVEAQYAENLERLGLLSRKELLQRFRDGNGYAGLVYAARQLRRGADAAERRAAMDTLRDLQSQLSALRKERAVAPRLALRDVQLCLAAGYRAGVRAEGDTLPSEQLEFRCYENAYELDPGCAALLAWCREMGYGTERDPARAAELRKSEKDGAASWKRLGDAYAALGLEEQAKACHAEAKRLAPSAVKTGGALRRRWKRLRRSNRDLKLIAAVLAIALVGLVIAGLVMRSNAGSTRADEQVSVPPEESDPTQTPKWEEIAYYGILPHKNGREYYVELTLGETTSDGTISAFAVLHQLDRNLTVYDRMHGSLTLSGPTSGKLLLESDEGSFVFALTYDGPTRWSEHCITLKSENAPQQDTSLYSGDAEHNEDAYHALSKARRGIDATYMLDSAVMLEDSVSVSLLLDENDEYILRNKFERENLINAFYILEVEEPVAEAESAFALGGAYSKLHFEIVSLADHTGRAEGDWGIWLDGVPVTQEQIKKDDEFRYGNMIDVTGVQELRIVLYSKDGGVSGNNSRAFANLYLLV